MGAKGLNRLANLRKYQGQNDISEWMQTEFRQNIKAIEDAFSNLTLLSGWSSYLSASQSITSTSETDILWDLNNDLVNQKLNTSTGEILIDLPGWYKFDSQALLESITANENYTFTLKVNDETKKQIKNSTGGSALTLPLRGLVKLKKGDFVKTTVKSTSDTSYSVNANLANTFFEAFWVGY